MYCAVVQRPDQFVDPMPGPGLNVPQLKTTAGSIRVNTGVPCKLGLLKYAPVQFVPVSAWAVRGGSKTSKPAIKANALSKRANRRVKLWVMEFLLLGSRVLILFAQSFWILKL